MPAPTTAIVAALPFDVAAGDVAANLEQAAAGLAAAARAGARLLALPEMWTTSFLPNFPAPSRARSRRRRRA